MTSHDIKDECARAVQNDSPDTGGVSTSSPRLTGDAAWADLEATFKRALKSGKASISSGQSLGEATTGAERSGAEGGDAAGVAADSRLLEVNRNQCGNQCDPQNGSPVTQHETTYEARRCRCKSWFCNDCCGSKGIAVRLDLIPILETFTSVQMWTLTIDPQLFDDPVAAFEYFKKNRCLSNLMRELRKLGVLHSDRYFYVVEWHKNGYAHWHLLIDASYVPKETVQAIWDSFRPRWAGPKPDDRPGFGIVRYSKRRFDSKRHAAQYATKYLIKPPACGYPDWVLDYPKRIRRYSTSEGLWGPSKKRPDTDAQNDKEADPEGCDEDLASEKDADSSKSRSTLRDRLAKCGQQTVLLAKHIITHEDGTREYTTEFLGQLKFVPYHDAKAVFGLEKFCISALPLTFENVQKLLREDRKRKFALYLETLALKGEARRAAKEAPN